MLRAISSGSVRLVLARVPRRQGLHSSSQVATHQPNAPLDLDPSLRALLNDVDLSLLRQKSRHVDASSASPAPRELELFPADSDFDDDYLTSAELDSQDEPLDSKEKRKSPAALFGSRRIGAVVLPLELQNSITRLIAGSDKSMLHVDAKRLFLSDGESSDANLEWDPSYTTTYKSRKAASRHESRDGTAFASVALPPHYSAVHAVLEHVKLRLGPSWNVDHVIDWGAGTGSALWASLQSFQKAPSTSEADDWDDSPQLSNSTVLSYIGIDKRDGLVGIGKKLVEGVDIGGTQVSWKKTYQGAEKPVRSSGEIVAISAFTMSALPTPLARKAMVKEMWESGADTIILIDHNSNAGFGNIAEAREFLLKQGRKSSETSLGSDAMKTACHVVAPCPHDGACPLYFSGNPRVVCGFSQRLQRPEFLRKTKHSGVGHEDIEYSYVVIRRGPRPARVDTQFGRVGEVGRREEAKLFQSKTAITELVLDGDYLAEHRVEAQEDLGPAALEVSEPKLSPEELEAALRMEAYSWPRLVFPPLKKAGHIILDGCTQEGKIMRMTVPKSQGKQPFYDARKSDWGDMFPHDPKNRPQVRFEAQTLGRRSRNNPAETKNGRPSSEALLNSAMEKEKGRLRRERKLARMQRSGL
ncbi:mitochondrial small ribosomal subunit Rsm22-domain-containing protein [Cristinia sonorae]|uniref:Mitochondrial small ribosomal subunit Rsm22-domain-containing protein n=1 Tax=Cristinia sonorae TaxID=1940300 RepID=A0A8K0XP45_9AGAR|nr:mitochondrial small ribosomal subunit Rsm22-domain-containing protein [Cristinia sonorae]